MRLTRIAVVIMLMLVISCSQKHPDARLVEIERDVSDHPHEALRRLDSIDVNTLSGSDRHLHDFLTVKSRDKAYIYHTSDNLILDVIDYYSSHQREYYPEALYYGGRVYSDLGDYPTALQYFRNALEELPSDTKDLELKCRILSQTGRLLNSLRLYEDAVPYIKQSLEIGKELKDTVGVIYDLQLLGGIYMQAKKLDLAEKLLKNALNFCQNYSDDRVLSKIVLAQVKYKTGQLDSALNLIRDAPAYQDKAIHNAALAYASNLYLKAGILDTAYTYANELIHSADHAHKETGYLVILSPQLRSYSCQDSLDSYISNYRMLLENYLNHNQQQLAITQQTQYNYSLHERERMRAEVKQKTLRIWLIVGGIGFIVIILFIVMYFTNRSKDKIIQLQLALDRISRLEETLRKESSSLTKENNPEDENARDNEKETTDEPTEQNLRERLRNKLIKLTENYEDKVPVPASIINSPVYRKLQDLINREKILKEDDKLWKEIENVVTESSPNFTQHLNLLTSGKLRPVEFQTALLIKCGIRPTQMAILFGKTNGTIVSRRETLSIKVFDKKVSIKDIDNVIRLL